MVLTLALPAFSPRRRRNVPSVLPFECTGWFRGSKRDIPFGRILTLAVSPAERESRDTLAKIRPAVLFLQPGVGS
jgi:hypothetical protein